MAVSLLSGTSGNGSTSGVNVTFAFTGSSGSDRLLSLQIRASTTVNWVTYAGAGLTLHSTGGNMTMWRKTAPATGSQNVVINMTNYQQAMWTIADWSGVDQTTPMGTQVTATGTSTTASTGSVTCPAGGVVFGGCEMGYSTAPGTVTITSGTSLGWSRESANGRRKAGGYRTTTGALSFSHNNVAWGAQAVPINPSVSFTAKLPQVYSQAVKGSVI